MALEGSEGSVSRPGRSLHLGKTQHSLYRRLGVNQGLCGQEQKNSHPLGVDPQTIQPITSCCTDYATWPTNQLIWYKKIVTVYFVLLSLKDM